VSQHEFQAYGQLDQGNIMIWRSIGFGIPLFPPLTVFSISFKGTFMEIEKAK